MRSYSLFSWFFFRPLVLVPGMFVAHKLTISLALLVSSRDWILWTAVRYEGESAQEKTNKHFEAKKTAWHLLPIILAQHSTGAPFLNSGDRRFLPLYFQSFTS